MKHRKKYFKIISIFLPLIFFNLGINKISAQDLNNEFLDNNNNFQNNINIEISGEIELDKKYKDINRKHEGWHANNKRTTAVR